MGDGETHPLGVASGNHLVDELLSVYTVESFLEVDAQEVDKFPIFRVLYVSSLFCSCIFGSSEERAQIVHVRGGRLTWPKAALIRM